MKIKIDCIFIGKKRVKSKIKLKRIIEVYLFFIRIIFNLFRCVVDIIKKRYF